MTTFANVESQIEALYVGYFGRAGDPAGVQFWLTQFAGGMSIAQISASFSVQTEATNLYPFLKNPLVDDAAHDNAAAFINSVFEDLFNRPENALVDPTGFAYWLGRVVGAASNPQAIGQIIEDIISGATGVDSTTLQNKVTVADFFTNDLAGTTQPFVGNAIAISQSTVANTTSDPATVTAQETVITDFINNVPPLPGVHLDLTPGIDHVVITTINTLDHVQGIIDTESLSTDSTYTVADNIHGNGLTNVDLAVVGDGDNSAALASMVGVAAVNFFMGTTSDLTINAALWNNVNNVSVVGESDDTFVDVEHLNVNNGNGIKLSINTTGASFGQLSVTGKVSGLSYTATVDSAGNGVGTVASFGTAGVDIVVGKSGTASVSLFHALDKTGANLSVGDISVGHVNVNVGLSGDANVTIGNEVTSHGHNATAGNVTVGNVNFTMAKNATGFFEVYNIANVEGTKGGNGVVGNITVGNITAQVAKGGSFSAEFFNHASVESGPGNGTEGNLTIGNISINGSGSQEVFVENYINNDVSGNATVGNITIGNISMIGGPGDQTVSIDYNGADAAKGNATAGNIAIGNVTMKGSGNLDFSIDNQGAVVDSTGNAISGGVTIGNVGMDAMGAVDNFFRVDNYAFAADIAGKGGVATVGNVTIGNITTTGSADTTVEVTNIAENFGTVAHNATAGNISLGNIVEKQVVGTTGLGSALTGAFNKIAISDIAYASNGNAKVGNISIGNISVNANAPSFQANATAEVFVTNGASATNGQANAGTTSIGNVTLNVGLTGVARLFVENYANGITSADSTGMVTVGNVSMQGGSGAKLNVTVENYAFSGGGLVDHVGSTGGITIGNVALVLSKALGTAQLFVSETGNQAGQVTVGNVSLQGHTGSDLDVTINEFAGSGGHASGLTIGNVSLTGAKATAEVFISETGGSTGLLKVGNVSMNAKSIDLSITNSATAGNAGGLQVGNVTLKGNTPGPFGHSISQHAAHGNAGALSVGNISMTVGKGQDMKLLVTNTGLNHVGLVTIGNVSMAVANTKAGAANHATLDIESSSINGLTGGNIQVGNIAISAGGESKSFAAANMAVHVTVDSADGSVTVGNVSASGGVLNTAGPVVIDNFAHFSNGADALPTWFTAIGSSVTVGNVDYSAYVGSGAYSNGAVDGIAAKAGGTLIDVSGMKGGGSLVGATAGTAIVDNSGQNAINVGGSTKADTILLQDVQTAVHDNGTAITAPQASMDSITGIHTGDVIGFAAGNYASGLGLTGTTPPTQAGASTYANFLAGAETAIDTNGFSFFSADVGGNTYVAMNHGGVVAEIVEVTGIHTFTVDGSGFLHFAT